MVQCRLWAYEFVIVDVYRLPHLDIVPECRKATAWVGATLVRRREVSVRTRAAGLAVAHGRVGQASDRNSDNVSTAVC